jgi:hypothetical protein
VVKTAYLILLALAIAFNRPDLRLPICLYGEMNLKSSEGVNERIQCSHAEAAMQFASSANAMR